MDVKRYIGFNGGKIDQKSRALPRQGVHSDISVILSDQAHDDGETEAGADACGLGSKERIENVMAMRFRDARSGVRDFDHNAGRLVQGGAHENGAGTF